MAFKYNGRTPKKITYNSKNVKRLVYNGTTVWLAIQPIYWFNRITNSDGTEEQVLTEGYQREWDMTEWCCDDLNYVSGSAYVKDIWHINPKCDNHHAHFVGTASGDTGGHAYADIYITQMDSNNTLTANGTEIVSTGVHTIDVGNTNTLNLKLEAKGVIHINYIYFHS